MKNKIKQNDWILSHKNKHICSCGCNKLIEIIPYHYYYGIPKYLKGHYKKLIKYKIDNWLIENNKKEIKCACGCGGNIIIKREHYHDGIPKFIRGHSNFNLNIKEKLRKQKIVNNPMFYKINILKRIKTINKLYKDGILKAWNKGKKCPQLSLENNPNWQGGKSFEPYGLEFNNKLKEQIRKRDNYRCQQCFRHQDELRTKTNRRCKLSIHHIDYNKKNNNPNNLISLCSTCHLQTNFKREDWVNYFHNKMRGL